MTLSQLTEFFGWVSVFNIGFLLFATICLVLMKEAVASLHGRLFNISQDELPAMYFKYLANYKVMTLVFCVAPYLSLKMMVQ